MKISYYNISIKPYFSILTNNFLYKFTFQHFTEVCEPSLNSRMWSEHEIIKFCFFPPRSDRPVHSLPPPRAPKSRARTLPVRLTRDDHHYCAHPRTTPGFFFFKICFNFFFPRTRRHSAIIKTSGSDAISLLSVSALSLRRDPGPVRVRFL